MNHGWEDLEQTRDIQISKQAPERKRGAWYLLTGLFLGLILGLVYAWLFRPVIYSHSTPASLGEKDKEIYRIMIAQVYAVTGDLDRAQLRLALLDNDNPVYALGSQAQRCMAEGKTTEARALALLASVLQSSTPAATSSPIPTQTLDFTPNTP